MFWDLGAAREVSISTGGKWLLEFIFEMGLKDEHVEFKNKQDQLHVQILFFVMWKERLETPRLLLPEKY